LVKSEEVFTLTGWTATLPAKLHAAATMAALALATLDNVTQKGLVLF